MSRPRGRLTGRFLLVAGGLALLGLNAAVFAAFTLPRGYQERNASARAEELRRAVEAARERNRELRRRDLTMRQNAVDVRRFYQKVVGTRETTLLPLLRDLQAVADGLHLKSGQQTYDVKDLKDSPLVRFRISMPVSASYAQLVAFLDRLERSPHFLTVDRIQIHEGGQVGARTPELELVFSAYFLKTTGGARGR